MKDVMIGLLGGGTIVQILNLLLTGRPARRRANADALGAEVAALEKTINVIYSRFEDLAMRYATETAALRSEIDSLRSRIVELENSPQ